MAAQVQVQAPEVPAADEWKNPQEACFKQGDDHFSQFHFEALVPKRDFIVGGKDKYPEVRHVKFPYKKLVVYTCFARVRYAQTGMGNSILNPESKKKVGKAAKMVVSISDSAKCKLSLQLTRRSFDDRLKDAQGRNPDFMRYLEFRAEVQRWLAWWIWTFNKAPLYIIEVKKAICTEERTGLVAEANGVKKHLEKEFQAKRMTKETYDEEKKRVQDELNSQLEQIKESAIPLDVGVDKFRQLKMHVTYAFKLDSVKSDDSSEPSDKKQKTGDGSAVDSSKEDENTLVGKKPETEHVQFDRNAFRWGWKSEFTQRPYVPPSRECETVFNATAKFIEKKNGTVEVVPGLVYDPPVFIEASNMGQSTEAKRDANRTPEQKEADAKKRDAEVAAAFNRPLPDDAVVAAGYSMSVYFDMPATGKAGVRDTLEQIIWLRPPTQEDLDRRAAWGMGGAGATMVGVNIQRMKKIPGAQPYAPTKDWGKEVQNASDDELKMLEEAMVAAREKRDREAAEKAKQKGGSSSSSAAGAAAGNGEVKLQQKPDADGDASMPAAVALPPVSAPPAAAQPPKVKLAQASPAKKGRGAKRGHEEFESA